MATGDTNSPALPLIQLAPRLSALTAAAMLLLALLWGLSIPVTKLALESMPPMTLTSLRFAIAVPCLFLLALGRHRIPFSALPKVATLGLLGIGIGNVSQAFGIAGAPASVGTIISATIPVFIVLFAALRLGQAVTRVQQFGLAAAFAGIALVALGRGDGVADLAQTTLTGAALVLVSAVTIAFYYVWSVELTARYGTVTVVAWNSLVGSLVLLPFTAWEIQHTAFQVEPVAVAAAAYLALLVTTAGLFLWLWLLRTVAARIAASVQFLQPIIGIAASAVMFGDRMDTLFVVGVVLVLTGVGLSIMTRKAQ